MTEITVEGARNLLDNPTADLTPLERGLLGDVITLTERLHAAEAKAFEVEGLDDPVFRAAYLNALAQYKHEPETERQTPEDHQRELKAWGVTSVSPVAGD